MNSIGEIISVIQERKSEALQKVRNMKIYLSENEIEKELQFKILKYIDYLYDERHHYMEEGTKLLKSLSENLKQDIYFIAHSKILMQ